MADLADRVEELRADRTHGGSWLARRALEALLAVIERPAETSDELVRRVHDAGRQLAGARPAMGAITHAAARLLASAQAASHLQPDQLQRLLSEEAGSLVAGRERAAASIAVHLADDVRDATVLTHSASDTVREAVLHAPAARVLCTDSPESRVLMKELGGEVVDVEEGLEAASLVLVGADAVFADGSVRNKLGTRPLAEAASSRGLRVLVAAELLKLAPTPPPIAEEEPDLRDVTPPDLVAAIVTEEGPCPPEDVRTLIDRTPFLRDGYRLLLS